MADEWWVRRVVLAALAVLGVVTVVFAVVAVGGGEASPDGEADPGQDAPTAPLPSPTVSEGPLRLGQLLVAAHHGSPVSRPPHTLEGYELAVEGGATAIETQVAMTRDGQLVVRSDNELSETTDVADREQFADRETTKTIDGEEVTGWFTEDFTLAELQTLEAVSPDPDFRPEAAEYDGELPVLSFDDLLTRLKELWAEQGREIALFVEPVRPAYFRSIGLPVERPLYRSLRAARLNIESEAVMVESDDLGVLRRVEKLLGDRTLTGVRVETADEVEREALARLPETVDVVVAAVDVFAEQCPFDLTDQVHDADLAMAVYPISYENVRLAPGFRRGDDPDARGNYQGQLVGLRTIGVDVVLAEAPVEAVEELADADARAAGGTESADPAKASASARASVGACDS